MSQLQLGPGGSDAWACPGEGLEGQQQQREQRRRDETRLEQVMARFGSTYYLSLVAAIGTATQRLYVFTESVNAFKVKLGSAHLLTHHEISRLSSDLRTQIMSYLIPTFADSDRMEDSQVLLATILGATVLPVTLPVPAPAAPGRPLRRRRMSAPTAAAPADGVLGELQRNLQHVARWVRLDPHPYSQIGDDEQGQLEKKTKFAKNKKASQRKPYKRLEEDESSSEYVPGVEAQPPPPIPVAPATGGDVSSDIETPPSPPPTPRTPAMQPSPPLGSGSGTLLSYETAFLESPGNVLNNTPVSVDGFSKPAQPIPAAMHFQVPRGEGTEAADEATGACLELRAPVDPKDSDASGTPEHEVPAVAASVGVAATGSQPPTREDLLLTGIGGEAAEPVSVGTSKDGVADSPTVPIRTSEQGTSEPETVVPRMTGEGVSGPSAMPVGPTAGEATGPPVPIGSTEGAAAQPAPGTDEEDEVESHPMPDLRGRRGGAAQPALIPTEAGRSRGWVRGLQATVVSLMKAARPSVPASAPDSPAYSLAAAGAEGLPAAAADAGDVTGSGPGTGSSAETAVSGLKAPSIVRHPITRYSSPLEVLEEVQRQHGIFRSALLRHSNRLWLEVKGRPGVEVVPTAAARDARQALLERLRRALTDVEDELREARYQMEQRARYVRALGEAAWAGQPPEVACQVGGEVSAMDAEASAAEVYVVGELPLSLQQPPPPYVPPAQYQLEDRQSCGRLLRLLCSCFTCMPRRQ